MFLISNEDAHSALTSQYHNTRVHIARGLRVAYSYTPSGDQPMGEQEMKIRGVH